MDRVTGTLHVVGNAGGLIHLRDGVVAAVDSPGSPGPSPQDGAFAIAVGEIERHFVDESVEPPESDGIAPDLLLTETARRLNALASLPFSLSPYHDRVVAARESATATAEQQEIIAHATGRRTARDIAFAVDKSLYSVTVEISGMLADGLLEIAPPATSFSFSHWGLAALRPHTAAGQTVSRGADQANPLPTRRLGRARSDPGIV